MSENAGKMLTRITPNTDTFYAVILALYIYAKWLALNKFLKMFVPVFTKKVLNFSAIDFLSVISSLTIFKLLGKESFCTLNFPMIEFTVFHIFLILFSHFFNLFWRYNCFDSFFNFSNKLFIHLVYFFIFWTSFFQEFLIYEFLFFPWRLPQSPNNPGTDEILWSYRVVIVGEHIEWFQ